MPNIDPITAFFGFAKEAMQATREWMAGSPTRKMKRAIEYGERYIRLISPHIDKIGDKKIIREAKEIEEDFFKNNFIAVDAFIDIILGFQIIFVSI